MSTYIYKTKNKKRETKKKRKRKIEKETMRDLSPHQQEEREKKERGA